MILQEVQHVPHLTCNQSYTQLGQSCTSIGYGYTFMSVPMYVCIDMYVLIQIYVYVYVRNTYIHRFAYCTGEAQVVSRARLRALEDLSPTNSQAGAPAGRVEGLGI